MNSRNKLKPDFLGYSCGRGWQRMAEDGRGWQRMAEDPKNLLLDDGWVFLEAEEEQE